MGFSPRGTCVGSRYGHPESLPAPFSRAPGISQSLLNGSPFALSPGSHHYGPPQAYTLRWSDSSTWPTPRRQRRALRRRTYPGGTGILTRFPFGCVELRTPLGPANPRLTNIAEETSPLRRWGFSPHFAATTAGILTLARSTGAYAPASTQARRLPTRWAFAPPGYRWQA